MALPDDIEYHDVRAWLLNTYFFVERKDGRHLCRYSGMRGDPDENDEAQVLAVDLETRMEMRAWAPEIRLWWPMMGFVNLPGEPAPLYVQRITARQWRRSFYTGGGQVEVRRGCFSRHAREWYLGGQAADELALALFKNDYPATVAEAREIISRDGIDGVALSRNCLISSAYGDHPAVIWREPGRLVGYLDRDNSLNPGTSGTSLYYRRAARFLATRQGGEK